MNLQKRRPFIERNNQKFFSHYQAVDKLFFDSIKKYASASAKILDCGAGHDFKVTDFSDQNISVVSMDIDEDGLRGNANCTKVLGDARQLPFQSGTFDLIVFKYVFEHLTEPRGVVQECSRCLKEGGRIIFLCPNGTSYVSLISRMTPLAFHKYMRKITSNIDHTDTFLTYYRFNSIKRIKQLMKESNFKPDFIRSYVGNPSYWEFSRVLHTLFCLIHRMIERLPFRHWDISIVGCFQKSYHSGHPLFCGDDLEAIQEG